MSYKSLSDSKALSIENARAHFDLLFKFVSGTAIISSYAVYRFRQWQQLQQKHLKVHIPQTKEIEWVDHVFRTQAKNCQEWNSKHKAVEGEKTMSMDEANALWTKEFGEGISYSEPSDEQVMKERSLAKKSLRKHQEDKVLHESVKAQREFAKKMIEGRLMTRDMLDDPDKVWNKMVEQYSMFLAMFRVYPSTLLVPTLYIDFVWHTHLRCPSVYSSDCIECCGRFIDHDDRISQVKLTDAFRMTRRRFIGLYGVPYVCQVVDNVWVEPDGMCAAKVESKKVVVTCGGGGCGGGDVSGGCGGGGGGWDFGGGGDGGGNNTCGGGCGGSNCAATAGSNCGGGGSNCGGGGSTCGGGGGGCGGGGGGCGGGGGGGD